MDEADNESHGTRMQVTKVDELDTHEAVGISWITQIIQHHHGGRFGYAETVWAG